MKRENNFFKNQKAQEEAERQMASLRHESKKLGQIKIDVNNFIHELRPLVKSHTKEFSAFVKQVQDRSKLVESDFNNRLYHGLLHLYHFRHLFVNSIEKWRPKSKNRENQWIELVTFLLYKYSYGKSFYYLFLKSEFNFQRTNEIISSIAQGKSNKELLKLFPYQQLSKKQLHDVMANKEETLTKAIRLEMLKNDKVPAKYLNAYPQDIFNSFKNELLETIIIKFNKLLAKTTMFSSSEIGPLWDYIVNHYNQPNWHMPRNMNELLLEKEEWHAHLHKTKIDKKSNFTAHRAEPLRLVELYRGQERITWTIEQILTSDDLFSEGKSMHHCVYSYRDKCAKGACTIWSMRFCGERRLTLELNYDNIVQVRGLANRMPTQQEMVVINQWKQKNNFIQIQRY